jgi:hypothetical protein
MKLTQLLNSPDPTYGTYMSWDLCLTFRFVFSVRITGLLVVTDHILSRTHALSKQVRYSDQLCTDTRSLPLCFCCQRKLMKYSSSVVLAYFIDTDLIGFSCWSILELVM